MSEGDTHVQESAPTEVASEEPVPAVGEVPQQVVQDDVYCHSFEYVPDGCHLQNEGYTTEDDDDEVGHFISLANMCRDEQLFTSYYQSLCRQQQPEQEAGQQWSTDPETEPQGSGQQTGEGSGGSKKRRKYSPIVEKRNSSDTNPLCEQETVDELQDQPDLKDLEGLRRMGIKYTPFKLTNELLVWKPSNIFKDRDFFYKVMRQYATTCACEQK